MEKTLLAAIQNGNLGIAEMLIEKGLNLDYRDEKGGIQPCIMPVKMAVKTLCCCY